MLRRPTHGQGTDNTKSGASMFSVVCLLNYGHPVQMQISWSTEIPLLHDFLSCGIFTTTAATA
jgi:hypothetical protein